MPEPVHQEDQQAKPPQDFWQNIREKPACLHKQRVIDPPDSVKAIHNTATAALQIQGKYDALPENFIH